MAEAENENILFSRDQGSDDGNIWDDTALIAAYDKAVGLMKSDAVKRNEKSPKSSSVERKTSKEYEKKTKPKTSSPQKWRTGDQCEAIYSEDRRWYSAIVKKVNHDEGTCIVEYADYGNVEEVPSGNVRLPRRFKHRGRRYSDLRTQTSETSEVELSNLNGTRDSDDSNDDRCNDQSCGRTAQNKHCCCHHTPQWSPAFNAAAPWSFPASHPPSPWHGSVTHSHPCAQPSFSSHKFNFPPPPPPVLPPLLFESTDDALASALMSWYVSGYHTGYYQAMKQHGKRHMRTSHSFH